MLNQGNGTGKKFSPTLIPLEDFKAVLGIDDREDKICRFCLITAAYSIESYLRRWLLRRKHFERIEFWGDLVLPLREYPVREVVLVNSEKRIGNSGELVEPEFYEVIPDCGTLEDVPFCLSLSPAVGRMRGLSAIKVVYWAGYSGCDVPADLAAACLELAVWNMNRYRGRRVGVQTTGTSEQRVKNKEYFEMSMPENVRLLLEPYKRKMI